jgi:hypothetical protein
LPWVTWLWKGLGVAWPPSGTGGAGAAMVRAAD